MTRLLFRFSLAEAVVVVVVCVVVVIIIIAGKLKLFAHRNQFNES